MKKNLKQLKTLEMKTLQSCSLNKIKGGGVVVEDLVDGVKPSIVVDDLVDGV